MDWTVYNFECADVEARDRFLAYFDREHPVDVPDDDHAVHENVRNADGEPQGAELAWLPDHEYLYLTALRPVDGVLEMTADHWERAVEASFDSTTETLRTATLYGSDGGQPVAVREYDGLAEQGGAGVLWQLAVEEGFRFRAYSDGPPTSITFAPITSAFEYVPEENLERFASAMADETGVERTDAAMAALRNDPAKEFGKSGSADGEATPDSADGDGLLGSLRDLLGL